MPRKLDSKRAGQNRRSRDWPALLESLGEYKLAIFTYREFMYWGAKTKATPDGRYDGDRLALTPEAALRFRQAAAAAGVWETLTLSTCNRTEVFIWGDAAAAGTVRVARVGPLLFVTSPATARRQLPRESAHISRLTGKNAL